MTKLYQALLSFILCLLVIIAANGTLTAKPKLINQDSTLRIIRATAHFGLVLPHHEEMTYFINDFSYGMDFNYGITKYNKPWYQYTNYPELGIGFFFNSFGNPDVFGSGSSLYGYIQPTIYSSSKFSFKSKIALGAGYVNKPYQEEANP